MSSPSKNHGRRGSYAAVAAAAVAAANGQPSKSGTASKPAKPASASVSASAPTAPTNVTTAVTSTPVAAAAAAPIESPKPALVPTALVDPNSRQARWAASHEADRARRASASGPSGGRTRSKSRSRSRSRSPSRRAAAVHAQPRASFSNVNDEVVSVGGRAASPPVVGGALPPTASGYSAPQPPSPTSMAHHHHQQQQQQYHHQQQQAGAAGAWHPQSAAGGRNGRRGSAASLGGSPAWGPGEPPGFVDRTTGTHSPDNLGAGARRPSFMSTTHAAELMHIAARKMAQKEEERAVLMHQQAAAAAAASHRFQQQQQHGEPGEVVDEEATEEYDQFGVLQAPGSDRTRSRSIPYDPTQAGRMLAYQQQQQQQQQQADADPSDLAAIWGRVQASHMQRGSFSGPTSDHGGYSAGPSGPGSPASGFVQPHRRSSTFGYPMGHGGPSEPSPSGGAYGDVSPGLPAHLHHAGHLHGHMPYTSLPSSPDRVERLRATQRRFSVSPTLSSGEYDQVVTQVTRRPLQLDHMSPRRHSVAGAYQPPGRRLSDALATLSIEEQDQLEHMDGGGGGGVPGSHHMHHEEDDYYDQDEDDHHDPHHSMPPHGGRRASTSHAQGSMGSGGDGRPSGSYSDVGRGIPLHVLPSNTILYIVEFKAGRSDIYYFADESGGSTIINKGDLVIVEADRGKDLGKVINNSITPHQIHMLQAQQSEALMDVHRVNREIHPKRIYRLAQGQEVQMLMTKMQDEAKSLAVCQTKVRQKKLPMDVVDAEYQWDRRKLTFYFIADRRIDFRELVRDLFKIYKTRIWMCAVSAIQKAPAMVTQHLSAQAAAAAAAAAAGHSSSSSSPTGTGAAGSPVAGGPMTPPTMYMQAPPGLAYGMSPPPHHPQQQQQQQQRAAAGGPPRAYGTSPLPSPTGATSLGFVQYGGGYPDQHSHQQH